MAYMQCIQHKIHHMHDQHSTMTDIYCVMIPICLLIMCNAQQHDQQFCVDICNLYNDAEHL